MPYKGAYFATFPPNLISPCVLASSLVGGTILEPFAGSGTTGKVALELGRRAIPIESKQEYVQLIQERCHGTVLSADNQTSWRSAALLTVAQSTYSPYTFLTLDARFAASTVISLPQSGQIYERLTEK